MTLSALQSQTSQSLSNLLAKIKAEQEQDPGSTSNPGLKKLKSQIADSLAPSGDKPQSGTAGKGKDTPLADLLSAATPDERAALAQFLGLNASSTASTATGTASPSLSNLSALLAQTKPGPAGDQARAAIVAQITSAQSSTQGSSALSNGDATPTLFSFLS